VVAVHDGILCVGRDISMRIDRATKIGVSSKIMKAMVMIIDVPGAKECRAMRTPASRNLY